MKGPIQYDHIEPLSFGGTLPEPATFDSAQVIVLPVPLDSPEVIFGEEFHPLERTTEGVPHQRWMGRTGSIIFTKFFFCKTSAICLVCRWSSFKRSM